MLYHLNLTLNHLDFQQNIHQKVLVFFGDLKCVKFYFCFLSLEELQEEITDMHDGSD